MSLQYLRRRQPFVLSIVPLQQVWVNFSCSKSSQLTGSSSTLQRAGKNFGEGQPLQPFAESRGVSLTVRSEWEIGEARVLAGTSPSSIAMPG
jgi:hypothetical protein